MALTRTRKLALAADCPPCSATVVHRFADNWTVRTLRTLGDGQREGVLMNNCLAFDADDIAELVSDFGSDWWQLEQGEDSYDCYRSLRDPDNLPRLTWRCLQDDTVAVVSDIFGAHNSPPGREHYERLCEWADALGIRVDYTWLSLGLGGPWSAPLTRDLYDRVVECASYDPRRA